MTDRAWRPLSYPVAIAAALVACAGAAREGTPKATSPVASASHATMVAALEDRAPAEARTVDRDNDGIPDDADACPTLPGAPNTDPRRNGCPEVRMTSSDTTGSVMMFVRFGRGRSQPTPESAPILREVAETLKSHPSIARVEVIGHASIDEPTPAKTSEARAAAVVTWLVAAGVDETRLVARGDGSDRPIAPNDSEANRSQSRRVEFHLVGVSQIDGGP